MGVTSQNVTVQPVTVCDGLGADRSEDILDAEVLDADASACRTGAVTKRCAGRSGPLSHGPDPTFVAHLIATAIRAPQTRSCGEPLAVCADGLRRQPDPPLRHRLRTRKSSKSRLQILSG